MTQTAAINNFLISDSLDFYIQGLLASCENYYSLRQFERIEGIVDILENLPLTKAQRESVVCYRALVYNWRKLPEKAKSLLESIADNSGRALIFLGTLNLNSLNLDEARRCYYTATKIAPEFTLEASHNIAVVESVDGNHKGSLRELERLLPQALSVKASQPIVYLDHLNSLAVELGEAGRIQEAGVVSKIVLASPYAFAYPEWRETGQDLALRGYRSRSSVPIIQTFPGNISYMPEREPSATPAHPAIFGPAGVRSIEKWKEEKMVKESNGNDDKNLDEMNDKDLFMEIMRLASQDSNTSKKLRKMVDALKKIASEKD
jgi:tetratricopeptide (TPR) repeat protein